MDLRFLSQLPFILFVTPHFCYRIMSHNILITGASGYLGGTLLARWASATLPPYKNLYALIRNEDQANAVKQYGAVPLKFDITNEEASCKAVIQYEITIVFFLIDASKADSQVPIIRALADVKKITGKDVHFLHVRI